MRTGQWLDGGKRGVPERIRTSDLLEKHPTAEAVVIFGCYILMPIIKYT